MSNSARRCFDSWWPTLGTNLGLQETAWAAFGAAWITRDYEVDELKIALRDLMLAHWCTDEWDTALKNARKLI